jgi:hypothetical protein
MLALGLERSLERNQRFIAATKLPETRASLPVGFSELPQLGMILQQLVEQLQCSNDLRRIGIVL